MNHSAEVYGDPQRFSMTATDGGFVYADDGTPSWYVWIRESRTGCVAEGCDPTTGSPDYERVYHSYPPASSFQPGTYANRFLNLDDAYQNLKSGDDSIKMKVVSDLVAKMADKAWRTAAAQPGYEGEPYPATNPITTEDVATYQSSNPAPTLDDMLRPASNPTTDAAGVPISGTITYEPQQPGTGTSTNVNVINTPNVNVVNQVKVDFGPDPGVSSPTLQQPPTGTEILSPLTGLFPELRSLTTPVNTGVCPQPAFDIFGKTMVMDSHCSIAEQHRGALALVMYAVWLIVSLRITLSA